MPALQEPLGQSRGQPLGDRAGASLQVELVIDSAGEEAARRRTSWSMAHAPLERRTLSEAAAPGLGGVSAALPGGRLL